MRAISQTIDGRTAVADVTSYRSEQAKRAWGTWHPAYKIALRNERQDARDRAALALHVPVCHHEIKCRMPLGTRIMGAQRA